jgi:hypothetical protein
VCIKLLKFYEVLAVSTVLYVSECWTQTEQENKTVMAVEVRVINAAAGYRSTNHNRSQTKEFSIKRIGSTTLKEWTKADLLKDFISIH